MEQRQKRGIQTAKDHGSLTFGGIQPFSLNNFPELISAVLFTQGCNLRCYYCHNPSLVYPRRFHAGLSRERVLQFLEKRRNVLEGVVISGGEPLLHRTLMDFLRDVKALGYRIKLDTNGTYPGRLSNIIATQLVDYVAMDLKGPFSQYAIITGRHTDVRAVKSSLRILSSSSLAYEIRITMVPENSSPAACEEMLPWLTNASKVYLQRCSGVEFSDSQRHALDEAFTCLSRSGISLAFR